MKILDQVRQRVRFKHYSLSTDESYVGWIKQFIPYHNIRQPSDISPRQAGSCCGTGKDVYKRHVKNFTNDFLNMLPGSIKAKLLPNFYLTVLIALAILYLPNLTNSCKN
jgi:hypothetical protein